MGLGHEIEIPLGTQFGELRPKIENSYVYVTNNYLLTIVKSLSFLFGHSFMKKTKKAEVDTVGQGIRKIYIF